MKIKGLCALAAVFFFSFWLSAGAQNLRIHPNNAWDNGEFLRYRVYYNSMLTGNVTAGEATIEIKSTPRRFFGREVWHIQAQGRSKGAFNWFFKVRNRYESFVDKKAVIPYLFVRRTREGSYTKDDEVYFYPQQGLAVSRTARKPSPIMYTILFRPSFSCAHSAWMILTSLGATTSIFSWMIRCTIARSCLWAKKMLKSAWAPFVALKLHP